jgi:hypothetical protein
MFLCFCRAREGTDEPGSFLHADEQRMIATRVTVDLWRAPDHVTRLDLFSRPAPFTCSTNAGGN